MNLSGSSKRGWAYFRELLNFWEIMTKQQVHCQLTQLECPTFLMSGGWQPQPGSRYPGCHAALDTCHHQPDEGIQLPANNVHGFIHTTISLDVSHQYSRLIHQLSGGRVKKKELDTLSLCMCKVYSLTSMLLCLLVDNRTSQQQLVSSNRGTALCHNITSYKLCTPSWNAKRAVFNETYALAHPIFRTSNRTFLSSLDTLYVHTCVWFSRKLYRLCKVQQLIKFLTFHGVHFHPTPFSRPSFPIFQGSGSKTLISQTMCITHFISWFQDFDTRGCMWLNVLQYTVPLQRSPEAPIIRKLCLNTHRETNQSTFITQWRQLMLSLVGINSIIKMKIISYLQELNFSVFGTTHSNPVRSHGRSGNSDHV